MTSRTFKLTRHVPRTITGLCLSMVAVSFIGITAPPAEAQLGLRVNPAPLVAPITAPVNRSLNILNNQVSRGLTNFNNSATRGLNQVNRSVNCSLNTVNRYSYGPRRVVRYPTTNAYPRRSIANHSTSTRSPYTSPQSLQRRQLPQSQPTRLSKEQIKALQAYQESRPVRRDGCSNRRDY